MLIDFCLGANKAIIYQDIENKNREYEEVKKYLRDNEVIVSLTLKEDLQDELSREIKIERNFLDSKKAIRRINGKDIQNKLFDSELEKLLLPNKKCTKPTLRQILSHNIRYSNDSISNTLKTLNKYTTNAEYETLNLFLLGCFFEGGERKQNLSVRLKQAIDYKKRLERNETKNGYEINLTLIDNEIKELDRKKNTFNLNEDFDKDFEELNDVKQRINKYSSSISTLRIRSNLIDESVK